MRGEGEGSRVKGRGWGKASIGGLDGWVLAGNTRQVNKWPLT